MPDLSRAKRFRNVAAAIFVNSVPKVNPNTIFVDDEAGNAQMEKPTNRSLPGAIDPASHERIERWSYIDITDDGCDVETPTRRP
jgi:hypothetical protein